MGAVVRMPRQHRQSPIHLLRQHNSRQLMRQRHQSQREHKVRPRPRSLRPPIRRPHPKHHPPHPVIPQPPQPPRKLLGRHLPAERVENHHKRPPPRLASVPSRTSIRPTPETRLIRERLSPARTEAPAPLHVIRDQVGPDSCSLVRSWSNPRLHHLHHCASTPQPGPVPFANLKTEASTETHSTFFKRYQ